MMTAKKTNDENIWPVHNEVRSADLQFHKEMRKKEKKSRRSICINGPE